MAINTLEFAKLMMTKLDQHAVIGATSGWMEANAGQVIYNGGDEVKIPTMSTQGMGEYDMDNGFVQGLHTGCIFYLQLIYRALQLQRCSHLGPQSCHPDQSLEYFLYRLI